MPSRIKIEDLPLDKRISKNEQEQVVGGADFIDSSAIASAKRYSMLANILKKMREAQASVISNLK